VQVEARNATQVLEAKVEWLRETLIRSGLAHVTINKVIASRTCISSAVVDLNYVGTSRLQHKYRLLRIGGESFTQDERGHRLLWPSRGRVQALLGELPGEQGLVDPSDAAG
jgi:hypothetical protein